jgi:guanosine-3',5'-bis(diphosphate) 3'-pyrophosphohydrolase
MEIQSIYQQTITFAALKHLEKNQTIPGSNLPYVVHLSNVAMEILIASQNSPDFNLAFAIKVALLHDILEDTSATFEDISKQFGLGICPGSFSFDKKRKLT